MIKNNNQTPDPKKLLNPFQRAAVDRAIEKANKARLAAYEIAQQVPRPRHEEDHRRELAFVAADFDYSFLVISALVTELRAAGIRGDRLREVMKPEIWNEVTVGDLGIFYEKQLYDLIENDSDGNS